MNSQIENTLADIRRTAESLEIFAWSATAATNDADQKRDRLHTALMLLERLQEQHAELKQAMEAGK